LTQRVLEVLFRQMPEIEHSGRAGAFRARLRGIAVNMLAFDGAPAREVAAELDTTVNAVLIAKSRVLTRLRKEASVLID
jgi:hypothetical protein